MTITLESFTLFLTGFIGYFLTLLFTGMVLPRRLGKWIYPTAAVLCAMPTFVKATFGFRSDQAFAMDLILMVIIMFILPTLLFKGPYWKCVGVHLFFNALCGLCDILTMFLLTPVYGDDPTTFSLNAAWIYACVATTLMVLCFSLAVLLFRSISMRQFRPFYLLFVLFPISLFLFADCVVFELSGVTLLAALVLGIACNIALLIHTLEQEKKAALEEELQETRHTMELEESHYKAVEEQREVLARIRHDFNNQLSAIGGLIETGETGQAQAMVDQLATDIATTRERPYCAIPVINAILTEKAQACAEKGLRLETELDLPAELPVEPIHLCSIFSNLLDNAAQGAEEWKSAQSREAVIRLSTMVDGDYLFIKTVNPALPSSAKPKPAPRADGRGYGTRILSDLAARYGGTYQSDYKDGYFTAMVTALEKQ